MAALLLLTVVAGGLDAISFLFLAGTFVSNQTGNVLLLGMSISESRKADARTTTTSLLCFGAGAAVVARLVPKVAKGQLRPPRAPVAVGAIATLILVGAALSWGTDASDTLLMVPLAVAMGGQTALAKRIGVAYLTGGYVSGSTTSTAMHSPVGDGSDRWWWYGVVAIATIASGAGIAALIGERSVPLALCVLAGLAFVATWLVRPGTASPQDSDEVRTSP